MSIAKKLPKHLVKQIEELQDEDIGIHDVSVLSDALEEWISEQEEARDEKSDAWRDNDTGQAHEAFVDQVRTLQEALQAVVDAWEQVDTSVPEYSE